MNQQKPVRRSAIGMNPLDGLIPDALPEPTTAATPRPVAAPRDIDMERPRPELTVAPAAPVVQTSTTLTADPAINTSTKPAKTRATFHIPKALFDEVRDAVVHLSGPPLRLNLAQFAEEALRRELERIRDQHNSGQPFPQREGELRGGRPVG